MELIGWIFSFVEHGFEFDPSEADVKGRENQVNDEGFFEFATSAAFHFESGG